MGNPTEGSNPCLSAYFTELGTLHEEVQDALAAQVPVVYKRALGRSVMASIRKRIAKDGSTSFLVRIGRKGHRPVTKTFSRLTDARIWAQSTESAMRERHYNRSWEAERRALADLIDRYREEIRDDPKKVAAGRLKHLDWWRQARVWPSDVHSV